MMKSWQTIFQIRFHFQDRDADNPHQFASTLILRITNVPVCRVTTLEPAIQWYMTTLKKTSWQSLQDQMLHERTSTAFCPIAPRTTTDQWPAPATCRSSSWEIWCSPASYIRMTNDAETPLCRCQLSPVWLLRDRQLYPDHSLREGVFVTHNQGTENMLSYSTDLINLSINNPVTRYRRSYREKGVGGKSFQQRVSSLIKKKDSIGWT